MIHASVPGVNRRHADSNKILKLAERKYERLEYPWRFLVRRIIELPATLQQNCLIISQTSGKIRKDQLNSSEWSRREQLAWEIRDWSDREYRDR